MGGMFKQPKMPEPETPKPVRMPVETDPEIIAAGQRTRQAAMQRKGRLSTILTDQAQGTSGYGATKLGAGG